MRTISFRASDEELTQAQDWASHLGLDESELLRDALRHHLARLGSELATSASLNKGLASGSEWPTTENWSDWLDVTPDIT